MRYCAREDCPAKVTRGEIRELGETQSIEFKKSLSLQREALEALCGMVNSHDAKGTVLSGVAPDFTISGIEPGNMDSAQRSLIQTVRQKFDPTIISSVEILECEEKYLLLLRAERAPGVAYHEYDGRAYIREGSTKRQLSYEEKQQLSLKRNRDRHNGPWRCNRCGSIVGTLMSMVVGDQGVTKSYDCDCGGEFWPL